MKKKNWILLVIALVLIAVILTFVWIRLWSQLAEYTFDRTVSGTEAQLRLQLVNTAEKWLGANEEDGSHKAIIDLYNSHTPLAQNYTVKYDDKWCATFVSAAAIECGLTDVIPTECGCQRQIGLFQDMDAWQEDDGYVPLPGDIIYYCWSDKSLTGDCTGWADHVGIVVGTARGRYIKVIEGNYDGQVKYRILPVNAPEIRGYGIPAFA